ncbi:unnamed protein product, partial [Allacma fusca]
LCGIIKVLLSRRARTIPPSHHFKTPNPECQALVAGRIQVVTEATPFKGNLAGINCFGIGGTSAHAMLEFDCIETQRQLENHSENVELSIDNAEWRSNMDLNTENIPF